MTDPTDAWTMLKRMASRNMRRSLYLAASTGWLFALTKLFTVHKVSGASMLPHLQEGDWIFTESVTTRLFKDSHPLSVGDVVVVRSPLEQNVHLVKRVIALEGDIVPNKSGLMLANSYDYDGHSIRVPENAMWVEGDNKYASKDSRHYGPVSRSLIMYRAVARIRPDFKKLADPWLVRLLNGDVTWTSQNEPPLTPFK